MGIDAYRCPVFRIKLVELHEERAAFATERRVSRSRWIADIGAGTVIAMLVGKDAIQDKDLFPEGMYMS